MKGNCVTSQAVHLRSIQSFVFGLLVSAERGTKGTTALVQPSFHSILASGRSTVVVVVDLRHRLRRARRHCIIFEVLGK